MAKKKRSILDIFRFKKTSHTKQVQDELKKAGLTEKERSSDVDKKPTEKKPEKPKERKVPPSTKENINRAHRIAMMLKRKKK